jgi:hypothetical protein
MRNTTVDCGSNLLIEAAWDAECRPDGGMKGEKRRSCFIPLNIPRNSRRSRKTTLRLCQRQQMPRNHFEELRQRRLTGVATRRAIHVQYATKLRTETRVVLEGMLAIGSRDVR